METTQEISLGAQAAKLGRSVASRADTATMFVVRQALNRNITVLVLGLFLMFGGIFSAITYDKTVSFWSQSWKFWLPFAIACIGGLVWVVILVSVLFQLFAAGVSRYF